MRCSLNCNAPQVSLKALILSKGNSLKFKEEIKNQAKVLYLGEGRQLTDIVFFLERSKRYIDQVQTVCFRGRLGETKEFALYVNEFLKDCVNLKSLLLIGTNLGGLMRGCKNVNMFRTTKLEYVNLTQTDNFEVDLTSLGNLFRLKKIKAIVEDDYSIIFPEM